MYLKCVACSNKPKVAHQNATLWGKQSLVCCLCFVVGFCVYCCRVSLTGWCVVSFLFFISQFCRCLPFIVLASGRRVVVRWFVVLLWLKRIMLQCANGLVVVGFATIAFTFQFMYIPMYICRSQKAANLGHCYCSRCHCCWLCLRLPAFRLFTCRLSTARHVRLRSTSRVATLYKNNYYSY